MASNVVTFSSAGDNQMLSNWWTFSHPIDFGWGVFHTAEAAYFAAVAKRCHVRLSQSGRNWVAELRDCRTGSEAKQLGKDMNEILGRRQLPVDVKELILLKVAYTKVSLCYIIEHCNVRLT